MLALVVGITGNRDKEREQFFEKQALLAEGSVVHASSQNSTMTSVSHNENGFYLVQPYVLYITSFFILISFAFIIILAKKNGLYIIGKKRMQSQYVGKGVQKELQYDQ